jgi:anti-sigma regulatory factor (Ser/Thr protein kinase)
MRPQRTAGAEVPVRITRRLKNPPSEQRSSSPLGLTLRGGPRAAGQARELVAGRNGMVPEAVRDKLLLLLTELVTNAVRHGGAVEGVPVEVVVARWSDGLSVAVTDPGAGFEWRRPQTNGRPAESGYGLLLVDQIAARWGIERGESFTTVWFELPLSPADQSPDECRSP